MAIVLVSDMVESNGKTVRENNMDTNHAYPLGALVEICYEDSDDDENNNGIRLFVVNHERDCDGTPLYCMAPTKTAYEKVLQYKTELERGISDSMERTLCQFLLHRAEGALVRGYSEKSLKLINA